jgi:transposase
MFAEASWQVFVLCLTIAMFLMWVMNLKKQIIALMTENEKLKKMIRDKVAAEAHGTKVHEDAAVWGRKSR